MTAARYFCAGLCCVAGTLAGRALAEPAAPELATTSREVAAAEPDVASAPRAGAESAPHRVSAWQLSAALGPTLTFGEAANPQYQRSTSRVGALALASLGYRSSYILDPGLDVAYAWLAHGDAELPAGPWGEGGNLRQRLSEWVISPAVSADLWRFRPRLGIGLAIVTQRNEFAASEQTATQISLVAQFGLGFALLQTPALRLDTEARLVLARGADVTFSTLDVSASFDLVRFHD